MADTVTPQFTPQFTHAALSRSTERPAATANGYAMLLILLLAIVCAGAFVVALANERRRNCIK